MRQLHRRSKVQDIATATPGNAWEKRVERNIVKLQGETKESGLVLAASRLGLAPSQRPRRPIARSDANVG